MFQAISRIYAAAGPTVGSFEQVFSCTTLRYWPNMETFQRHGGTAAFCVLLSSVQISRLETQQDSQDQNLALAFRYNKLRCLSRSIFARTRIKVSFSVEISENIEGVPCLLGQESSSRFQAK